MPAMNINSSDPTKLLKERYSPVARDQPERILDGINKLIAFGRDAPSLQAFLEETGRTIHRLFEFKEIAIGLRSKQDGLYRYEILIGFSREAAQARKSLTYSHEEMVDAAKYPGGIMIGKNTEFMLVEHAAFKSGEESSFNRPSMLKAKRASIDDFIDDDYISIYLHGQGGDRIGWLEFASTRSGKVPERATMKWLELIASVVAMTCTEREPARF